MNDAAPTWWIFLDTALRSYGMVLTRADRCCYVLYSIQSRERAWEHWGQRTIAQHGIGHALTESRQRSETEDPPAGSPATGKSVARIINLFVDGLGETAQVTASETSVLATHRRIS